METREMKIAKVLIAAALLGNGMLCLADNETITTEEQNGKRSQQLSFFGKTKLNQAEQVVEAGVGNGDETSPQEEGFRPESVLFLKNKATRTDLSSRMQIVFADPSLNPCKAQTLSLNGWLRADHEGPNVKNHNEKPYGFGIVYSCEGSVFGEYGSVFFQGDRMKNSNRGIATLTALGLRFNLLQVGKVDLDLSFGKGYLRYEVPKYRRTLAGFTSIAFLTVRYESFAVNIAPVPKAAGNADILWITYQLARWE